MTKIYSVLLAWDLGDIPEQGTYATVVHADDHDQAKRKAQEEMAAHEDGSDDPDSFLVLDITEGVNIWAAKALLVALDRAVQDIDGGWNAEEADEHFPWLASARVAIAQGEGAG